MEVQTLVVGELQTNCYLVIDNDQCLIIDPGDNANYISEQILYQDLTPTAIIATHGHFDHVLAANELQMAFNIPFYIHKKDMTILNYMSKSAQHWLKREIIEETPKKIKFLKNKINNFKILHTPGHSPGSVCLYNEKEKIAFVGDLIFPNGIGQTNFPYCSKTDMQKSLKIAKQKFTGFTLYPGHESKFVL